MQVKEPKQKSQSQRLRAVLFLLYQEDNKSHVTFESYYADLMEKIINNYKTKLPVL
jgi:hypothetical protein